MVELSRDFSDVDGRRRSDWFRLQEQFAQKRMDRERQKQKEDQTKEDIEVFGQGMVIATEIQIAQFESKLDTYDTATVAALMENQQQLDAVKDKIETMLEHAYVLRDGRRVFRTEDGTQVFDEFGEEILPEEIDPDLIGSEKPSWEEYSTFSQLRDSLETERTQLLEFQEKVDTARERISNGDISVSELEALDAELLDSMPASVKSQLPEYGEINASVEPDNVKSPQELTRSDVKDSILSNPGLTPG